ncbi:MAG: hypothetical protein N838_07380 [Thiohalocapsa sp. PB-PSB1]|jgi:hypothetical protein|nr:MAG: hypothetical protein N838_28465 [Thiohalocapsa sp. PB-PSB1]QQO53209.1 MAG: hypothetical protein N838_07380 [Thiohalocapsa sp. PB-PSB1]
MSHRSRGRRFDPFALLIAALVIGMSLTLAYQFSLYHGKASLPMAKESPADSVVGG